MRSLAPVLLAAVLGGLGLTAPSADARRFFTGFDDAAYKSATQDVRSLAFERTTGANGRIVRIDVIWADVAPTPPGNPLNPGDPAYRFQLLDQAVRDASLRGLAVLLTVAVAPAWAEAPARSPDAQPGSWRPSPEALQAFAAAVAHRYSGIYVPRGAVGALPKVRYYQAWNEPNIAQYLSPQYEGTRPASPGIYRKMLNAFYAGAKGVDPTNVIVSGGTAPFGDRPGGSRVRPLAFWRRMLCLRGRRALKPRACPVKARFNVAAHHPLNTVGGPRQSAAHPDDVVMPDMHALAQVVRVAERHRLVRGGRRHPLWATEFWWETDPPDPGGVPAQMQARWIEEAFFVLFKQRVRVALMIGLADEPFVGVAGSDALQSGLFFADGAPKPSLQAFRFPFVVSDVGKSRAGAWLIAPATGVVQIERWKAGGWRTVRQRAAERYDVIQAPVPPVRGKWRATVGAESSLVWRFRPDE